MGPVTQRRSIQDSARDNARLVRSLSSARGADRPLGPPALICWPSGRCVLQFHNAVVDALIMDQARREGVFTQTMCLALPHLWLVIELAPGDLLRPPQVLIASSVSGTDLYRRWAFLRPRALPLYLDCVNALPFPSTQRARPQMSSSSHPHGETADHPANSCTSSELHTGQCGPSLVNDHHSRAGPAHLISALVPQPDSILLLRHWPAVNDITHSGFRTSIHF